MRTATIRINSLQVQFQNALSIVKIYFNDCYKLCNGDTELIGKAFSRYQKKFTKIYVKTVIVLSIACASVFHAILQR